MVTKAQFTHLAQLLGMNEKIDLNLDPHIVFLLSGTERILTNFRLEDRNSCTMGHTSRNIQHSLTRILTELEITWGKTITALSLYGQQKILDNFATCLGTEQLTLDFLLLTDTSNYEFCIRGLFKQYQPEVETRVKRDIGMGSMIFGNGRKY